MPQVVTSTQPTEDGEMLWMVHYMSSYYDDDDRMPGQVPVDCRVLVLAKNRAEALTKAEPDLAGARRESGKDAKVRLEVTVVTLEDLIAARDSSDDGRMGWSSATELEPVTLSHPDDVKRYRLAVCLVPVEE